MCSKKHVTSHEVYILFVSAVKMEVLKQVLVEYLIGAIEKSFKSGGYARNRNR